MGADTLALTYSIDTGPSGGEVGAFFDLDGTLLSGFSAAAFVRDRLATGRVTLQDLADVTTSAVSFRRGGLGFSGVMAAMARMLRDTPEREMIETGERIFTEQLEALLYEDARTVVDAHRRRGHTLAIVTAATRYQAAPVARALDVPHLLCTELEVKGGRLTGRVLLPTCWGEGKLRAARGLAEREKLDLARSYFYSDGYEDLPLLEAVGRPHPTNPDRDLDELSRRRAWPVLRFGRSEPATRLEQVRSLVALSMLPSAAATSASAALLSERLRSPLNLFVTGWSEILTRVTGVELRVTGRSRLRAKHPVVYLFNHKSALDALLVAQLLGGDFAPLVQRNTARSAPFRAVAALASNAFVEEPEASCDREALAPAVAVLEGGISLVAAPERSRPPSPRLGAFREMPFRIAFEAGAPLVPIVIHDSPRVLPRNELVVRSGSVGIEVLEPIETKSWRRRDLLRHIHAVRERYAAALGED